MFVSDIKPEVSDVELTVVCAQLKKGVTKTGSPYLLLTLRDRTGDIDARMWDVKPEDEAEWKKGRIYDVQAKVTQFNGLTQLRINTFKPLKLNRQLAEQVFPKADLDLDQTFAVILATVRSFKNESYRKILCKLLETKKDDFMQWPAAVSHHHAVVGGLLWHSFTMLKVAQALQTVYDHLILDWELLFSGVILHDFGKIVEIDREALRFSERGMLLGHISIMQAEIQVLAHELQINHHDVTLLQHMVLASHGKMEFGSPVPPRLIEAELLSFIDNMDARLYMINHALKNVKPNEATPALKPLEFRSFLRHDCTSS